MENLKKSKLLNTVLFFFSLIVCTLITLPIAAELDSVISSLILISINSVGVISLSRTLERKLNEHVLSEVQRHKYRHVQEFFDAMEDDLIFNMNVLREDIPIYDEERKKIGTQTVYSAISEKKYKFLK
jgi:hypothetical protein